MTTHGNGENGKVAAVPLDWPAAVQQYLRTSLTGPLSVEELLSGQSSAGVFRVRGATQTLIAKRKNAPEEALFYQQIAHVLRDAGIPIPEAILACRDDTTYWLLLEDIPGPLPKDRWLADPGVIQVLARLHSLPVEQLREQPGRYVPQWTSEITHAALNCLPDADRQQFEEPLCRLQYMWQHLFEPSCPISGDPNPTNWGLRADDTPVLFDWERFSFGTPALDLAITIPGFGDAAAYRHVAEAYLLYAGHISTEGTVDRLAEEIAIAKLWSVLEYLSQYASGELTSPDMGDRLVPSFVHWVASLPAVAV